MKPKVTQPKRHYCGRCGAVGHNKRTCFARHTVRGIQIAPETLERIRIARCVVRP